MFPEKLKIWILPWRYAMSFIFMTVLLFLGALADYFLKGRGFSIPELPYNFYLLFVFSFTILYVSLRHKSKPVIVWLSGMPAAISAITGYIICVLCIAYFEHENSWISFPGITPIKTSIAFLIIHIYLLTCLEAVIIRKIFPFKLNNVWFLINHIGLFIVIIATLLGSGDLKRVHINLLENEEPSNIGIANNKDIYRLPFTLKLLDFSLDEFYPKLAIIDTTKNKRAIISENKMPLNKIKNILLLDWYISILEYSKDSFYQDSTIIINSNIPGGCAAAYIEIFNLKQKTFSKNWITTGSYNQKEKTLYLQSNRLLTLTYPKPRNFSSRIVITRDSLKTDTLTLEVNKPIKIGGWKIFQIGYDKSKGKWSTLSVIEAVSDPWNKFTVFGALLFATGLLGLLLTNIKKTS